MNARFNWGIVLDTAARFILGSVFVLLIFVLLPSPTGEFILRVVFAPYWPLQIVLERVKAPLTLHLLLMLPISGLGWGLVVGFAAPLLRRRAAANNREI